MSISKVVRLFTLAFAASLLIFTNAQAFRNIEVGQEVPGFTLNDTAGKQVSLSGYSGKAVVVVFFKPGHDRSVDALADLQKISEKYAGKAVVLAVTPEAEPASAVTETVKKAGATYAVLIDGDKKVYGDWGVFLFPTTGVVDKEGKLTAHVSSHNRKYAETVDGSVRLALGEITSGQLDELLNPKEKEELTDEQKKASRHMMLAQRMVDRKMLDRAAEEYSKAVEADPDLVEAQVKYGFVLLKLGEIEKARACFEKAIEKDEKAEDAKTGLGASHVAAGDLDKGIEILEGSLKLNPKPARAHYELGKAYEKKGNAEKSLEHYKAAAEGLGGASW